MRVLDILFEGNLKKQDFYLLSRLDLLLSKLTSKPPQPFVMADGSKQIVKASRDEIAALKSLRSFYSEPSGADKTLPGGKPEATKLFPGSIGGIPLSKFFKSGDIGGKGGSLTSDADGGLGNIGPAVECLKAMALYAKFINRTGTPTSVTDVLAVRDEVAASLQWVKKKDKKGVESKTATAVTSVEKSVPDFGGKVEDTFSLYMDLARGSFQRAMAISQEDKELWGNLQAIILFVNTDPSLRKYWKFLASDQKRDPVAFACVGGEGKKTDISTTYTTPEGEKRPLKHLNLSLKAASATIAQAPGTDIAGITKLFTTLGLSAADAQDAIDNSGYIPKTAGEHDKQRKAREQACPIILEMAAIKLNDKLQGLDDAGEGRFLDTFLKSLIGAMIGDETLIYVSFNANGTYHRLNPLTIRNLTYYIDLAASYEKPESKRARDFRLFIKDIDSGKALFTVRLSITGAARISFIFELKDLLDLVKEANDYVNSGKASKEGGTTASTAIVPPAPKASLEPAATDPVAPTSKKILAIKPVSHTNKKFPPKPEQPEPNELAPIHHASTEVVAERIIK
jgi:hypothetical protein